MLQSTGTPHHHHHDHHPRHHHRHMMATATTASPGTTRSSFQTAGTMMSIGTTCSRQSTLQEALAREAVELNLWVVSRRPRRLAMTMLSWCQHLLPRQSLTKLTLCHCLLPPLLWNLFAWGQRPLPRQ